MERAFRSIKTGDLHVRPVFQHIAQRVRAHVFLAMRPNPLQAKVFELLGLNPACTQQPPTP